MVARMRAIVIEAPGGPEVLKWREVPTPEPERGEVRVRVRATAVNRADLLQRMGLYPAPPDAPQQIPGLEFAGEIDAVGAGVSAWKPGDRVFGLVGGGAYAEQLVTHADCVARMPDALSFTDAAAIPEAFITAWDAMVSQAGLGAGETRAHPRRRQRRRHRGGADRARAVGAAARHRAHRGQAGARAASSAWTAASPSTTASSPTTCCARPAGAASTSSSSSSAAATSPRTFRAARRAGRIVLVGLMAGVRGDLDLGLILRKRLVLMGTQLRARPLGEKIEVTRSFERHVVPLVEAGAAGAGRRARDAAGGGGGGARGDGRQRRLRQDRAGRELTGRAAPS